MLCNTFQSARHPRSAPSHAGILHVVHVLWTQPTHSPKLHLDLFSNFRTAYGRESQYFTMCIKMRLTSNLKN